MPRIDSTADVQWRADAIFAPWVSGGRSGHCTSRASASSYVLVHSVVLRPMSAHAQRPVRLSRPPGHLQPLRPQIDAIQADLATVRAERDAALEQAARLRVERGHCDEIESRWEQTLGESECQHRAEIDALAQELRTALQRVEAERALRADE